MFKGTVTHATLGDMPSEYREALFHQLAANGEGELSAGDTYVDSFYPLAPDADERHLCALFAAEEIDHYRKFAALLAGIGGDISSALKEPKASRRFFPAESMNVTFTNWEERGAFSFLCELEGHYQINEMVDSSYEPLRSVATSILREEARHFSHGAQILKKAARVVDSKARAQAALDRFYPLALDMFGRSDSRRASAAVEWGLRKHTNAELRELYKDEVTKLTVRYGYQPPKDTPSLRKYI